MGKSVLQDFCSRSETRSGDPFETMKRMEGSLGIGTQSDSAPTTGHRRSRSPDAELDLLTGRKTKSQKLCRESETGGNDVKAQYSSSGSSSSADSSSARRLGAKAAQGSKKSSK